MDRCAYCPICGRLLELRRGVVAYGVGRDDRIVWLCHVHGLWPARPAAKEGRRGPETQR